MQSTHLIRVFVLLVVLGAVFAFVRSKMAVAPSTTTVTSSAPSAPPSPLPPPPPASRETASQKAAYKLAFEHSRSSVPAMTGLACIQDALGGVNVLASVTSLRIVGSKREIDLAVPGRHSQTDVRQILMRLPRELTGVSLLQRTTLDAGQERLAIDASGLDGLAGTLLADPDTCVPLAFEYRETSTTTANSSDTYRVELSQYRRFGGILFATELRITKNGKPWEDEHVSEIQVNR